MESSLIKQTGQFFSPLSSLIDSKYCVNQQTRVPASENVKKKSNTVCLNEIYRIYCINHQQPTTHCVATQKKKKKKKKRKTEEEEEEEEQEEQHEVKEDQKSRKDRDTSHSSFSQNTRGKNYDVNIVAEFKRKGTEKKKRSKYELDLVKLARIHQQYNSQNAERARLLYKWTEQQFDRI